MLPIGIAISVILTFVVIGLLIGIAAAYAKNGLGELPFSSNASGSSNGCYLTDNNWTNSSTEELPDAKTVISKLGDRKVLPSEDNVNKILIETRKASVNPAVAIATWGKEQGFNPNKLNFAFGAGTSSNFDEQLRLHIKTLTDARDGLGYYANRPVGTPIQVWWIDIYTPASDSRNDVPQDRATFISFLKKLVPDQVVCNQNNSYNQGLAMAVVARAETELKNFSHDGSYYWKSADRVIYNNYNTNPWCLFFVEWLYKNSGYANMPNSGSTHFLYFEALKRNYSGGDMVVFDDPNEAKAGDIMLFTGFDVTKINEIKTAAKNSTGWSDSYRSATGHTTLVRSNSNGIIRTIEGNVGGPSVDRIEARSYKKVTIKAGSGFTRISTSGLEQAVTNSHFLGFVRVVGK